MALFARDPAIFSREFLRDPRSERATNIRQAGVRPGDGRAANECAQCGEPIFMPEWSEWVNPGCARHLWQCEACGYSYETTVRFAAA